MGRQAHDELIEITLIEALMALIKVLQGEKAVI